MIVVGIGLLFLWFWLGVSFIGFGFADLVWIRLRQPG